MYEKRTLIKETFLTVLIQTKEIIHKPHVIHEEITKFLKLNSESVSFSNPMCLLWIDLL